MKADIHPDYHEITVVMTDGTEYKTHSCWGKEGDVMKLDVDCLSHPAWSKDKRGQITEKGQLDKFKNKYGGLFGEN